MQVAESYAGEYTRNSWFYSRDLLSSTHFVAKVCGRTSTSWHVSCAAVIVGLAGNTP